MRGTVSMEMVSTKENIEKRKANTETVSVVSTANTVARVEANMTATEKVTTMARKGKSQALNLP